VSAAANQVGGFETALLTAAAVLAASAALLLVKPESRT
jgi:hypothetical protein